MSVLSAGLQSVGLCVSRRLRRRAPAGLPQNKENPTKLQGDDIAHAVRSALEMDDRGFTIELTVFTTNPKD